jgi:DNA-binding response OmpR family regulator
MRLLIVEDEALVAFDIEAALMAAGLEITGLAISVRAALHLLQTEPCDAAVLDANLNGESAEPVATALQERGIPFVVLSGYGSEQRPPALRNAPFVTKPFAYDQLIRAVDSLLAPTGS